MTDGDIAINFPELAKSIGAGAGYVAAGFMFLRQYLSNAKVDRTANDANVATIMRLQDELRQERERGDNLMHEREAMVGEIGALRTKVDMLSQQVDELKGLIHSLKVVA